MGNDTRQDTSFFNKKQEKQGKTGKTRGKTQKKHEKQEKKQNRKLQEIQTRLVLDQAAAAWTLADRKSPSRPSMSKTTAAWCCTLQVTFARRERFHLRPQEQQQQKLGGGG